MYTNKNAGFLMLELILTLAVTILVVFVIARNYAQLSSVYEQTRRQMQAFVLARSYMDLALLNESPDALVRTARAQGFSCSHEITSLAGDMDRTLPGTTNNFIRRMYKCAVQVAWQEGRSTHSVRLVAIGHQS